MQGICRRRAGAEKTHIHNSYSEQCFQTSSSKTRREEIKIGSIYGRRTPIAPESEDRLFISRIPDIFQTGHTHIAGDETYKGVTLLNSGTFQYQTSYQRSMNINPTTGQTYIINLKLLQRTQVDFHKMS